MQDKVCSYCGRAFSRLTRCPDCRLHGSRIRLVSREVVEATPGPDRYLLGVELDGRYAVEAFIDKGSMGSVYRGRQIALEREVAIKVLNHKLVDPKMAARFRREAKVLGRLNHPNIVQIHDMVPGTTEGGPGLCFIVMELVHGCSLRDLLSGGPMDPKRYMGVTTNVLKALDLAHRNGVVHRDLKPDNVLLDRKSGLADHVKILDFGLAKILGTGTRGLTVTGIVFGTPSYMSPEQWCAEGLDGRSDLYSLGVMLFEMPRPAWTEACSASAPSSPATRSAMGWTTTATARWTTAPRDRSASASWAT